MNIAVFMKESLEILRRNVIFIAPPVIASLVVAIIAEMAMGTVPALPQDIQKGAASPEVQEAMRSTLSTVFTMALFSYLLQVFAQGVIIVMAVDLMREGRYSVQEGFKKTLANTVQLITAALIFALLILIGMLFLLLPALIVAFLFMFTFIIVMTEKKDALGALQKSYRVTRANFGDCLILFLVLAAIGFVVTGLNLLLSTIPYLGQAASIFLMSAFAAFSALTLLQAYQGALKEPEPAKLDTGDGDNSDSPDAL